MNSINVYEFNNGNVELDYELIFLISALGVLHDKQYLIESR